MKTRHIFYKLDKNPIVAAVLILAVTIVLFYVMVGFLTNGMVDGFFQFASGVIFLFTMIFLIKLALRFFLAIFNIRLERLEKSYERLQKLTGAEDGRE